MKKFPFSNKKIYFWLLVILACGLPFFPVVVSSAQMLLLLNWILEGNFSQKWQIIKSRKSLVVFLFVFSIHILGLAYTSDFSWAFHDLKIKLPLLLLPLIIATSPALERKQINMLIILFCTALFIKSLDSLAILWGFWNKDISNIRNISRKISHIRFALMIVLTLFLSIYSLIYKQFNKYQKYYALFLILWLTVFLFVLQSATGIVILFAGGFIYLIILAFSLQNKKLRYTFFGISTLIVIGIITGLAIFLTNFHQTDNIDYKKLDTKTINGASYSNDTVNKDVENGHYVYIYICDTELKKEWNKRSKFSYDSLDKRGQMLKYTLFRYMTSMNLRKDSAGLAALSAKDIASVEKGNANCIYTYNSNVYAKLYEIVWQIDDYIKYGDASGQSVTLRVEYLKTAFRIIENNLLIGVGTGDIVKAFENQYKIQGNLLPQFQKRTHNQYVTFMVTFGIIGFLIIMFAMLYPVYYEKKWNNYLFLAFAIVGFLSMLNEDTLETQVGVTFFALFYSLFLFGQENAFINTINSTSA